MWFIDNCLSCCFGPTIWVDIFKFEKPIFPYKYPALFSVSLSFLAIFIISKLDIKSRSNIDDEKFTKMMKKSIFRKVKLIFIDIDRPHPHEIKEWMRKNKLNIDQSAEILGISKRQFSRFLSGETQAKRVHGLAMQMVWILYENKKEIIKNDKGNSKKVTIPIK